jgi:uncharacterized coiled-coil DUF342 family protein
MTKPKPKTYTVPPEVLEHVRRLKDERDRLRNELQAKSDEVEILRETINVLRDCLASTQARANLMTALDKADTAAVLNTMKPKA